MDDDADAIDVRRRIVGAHDLVSNITKPHQHHQATPPREWVKFLIERAGWPRASGGVRGLDPGAKGPLNDTEQEVSPSSRLLRLG